MMTRYLIILLVMMAPCSVHAATRSEANALMSEGQAAYAAGNYAEALALFDSVRTEFSSTALLYNIGNCHFKLGDIPHAILYYERALRLSPGAEDVRANLGLAQQQVVDRVNELPSFSFGSTWGRIRGGKDPDQWARRSLWAGLAFFLVLGLTVILRDRVLKRIAITVSALALLSTVLSVVFASVRHAEINDTSEAIILTPKVDVRSEPREGTTVLFVLHKGTKVTVLQEMEKWYEVRLPNGNVGWMPPSTLERI